MSEIELLTARAHELSASIAVWNNWYMVLVALTVLLAGGVFVTQFVASKKSTLLSGVQEALITEKDRIAKADSKDKDEKIADARKQAAESNKAAGLANEAAAKANQRAEEATEKAEQEKLARIKIERQFANRHIPAAEWSKFAKSLSAFAGQKVVIDVFPVTFEHVVIAEEIRGILSNAHWNVPLVNRLTIPPAGGILVQGVLYQATDDRGSQSALQQVFELFGPYTSGMSSSLPLPNPGDPRIWIFVGDTAVPLRDWVK